jgi:hypothetical protein
MVVVRVARMAARLRLGRHDGWGNVSYAMHRGGPVYRQGVNKGVLRILCAFSSV